MAKKKAQKIGPDLKNFSLFSIKGIRLDIFEMDTPDVTGGKAFNPVVSYYVGDEDESSQCISFYTETWGLVPEDLARDTFILYSKLFPSAWWIDNVNVITITSNKEKEPEIVDNISLDQLFADLLKESLGIEEE